MLEKMGVLPIEVKAATKTRSTTSISTSGAMKQYIICSQTSKRGKIFVTYTATWLDEAHYRNKDVCGVSIRNGKLVEDSWVCNHHATYRYTNMKTGKVVTTKQKSTTPKSYYVQATGGVFYSVNLFGNRGDMNISEYYGGKEEYINEFITIRFECRVANRNDDSVSFT